MCAIERVISMGPSTPTALTSTAREIGTNASGYTPEGCLPVLSQGFKPWDNPEDLITRATRMLIERVLYGVMLPPMSILGLCGNLFIMAVFYKQNLRVRINLCVFVLALSDIFVTTTRSLILAESFYSSVVSPSISVYKYVSGWLGFAWLSQFVSCVIATERCACVVIPFLAQRFLKTSTMCAIIFLAAVLLVGAMAIIVATKQEYKCVYDVTTGKTSMALFLTRFYFDNKSVIDFFDIFVFATTLPVFFLVVIIITTIITVLRLHSMFVWRDKSAASITSTSALSSKEVAVTKMLIGTSILHIVCLTPNVALQMTIFIVPDMSVTGRYYNFYFLMWALVNIFKITNSSFNFFVYFSVGSKFRQTFWGLLSCARKR